MLARRSSDLLELLNQRTELQLRRLQTVEGLSVPTITYYAVGILAYTLSSLRTLVFTPQDCDHCPCVGKAGNQCSFKHSSRSRPLNDSM